MSLGSSDLKIWLLVRKDLELPLGKHLAQAGHACTQVLWNCIHSNPDVATEYMTKGQAKISVYVRDLSYLEKLIDLAKEESLPATLIKDAGRTVFSEPTVTLGAVGPCLRSQLPKKIQRLSLVNEFVYKQNHISR